MPIYTTAWKNSNKQLMKAADWDLFKLTKYLIQQSTLYFTQHSCTASTWEATHKFTDRDTLRKQSYPSDKVSSLQLGTIQSHSESMTWNFRNSFPSVWFHMRTKIVLELVVYSTRVTFLYKASNPVEFQFPWTNQNTALNSYLVHQITPTAALSSYYNHSLNHSI